MYTSVVRVALFYGDLFRGKAWMCFVMGLGVIVWESPRNDGYTCRVLDMSPDFNKIVLSNTQILDLLELLTT